jgi:hypothetical protein
MSTVRRPSARHALAAAALAVGAVLLSACGGQTAGSAATFGDSRITEEKLSSTVQEILVAQGQPATTADTTIPSQTLGLMLTMQMVDIAAGRAGVSITQGAIDQAVAQAESQAGSHEALIQSIVDQGVAPSQLEDIVRLQLQASALGVKLLPDGTQAEQSDAAFKAVSALSAELNVTASPRYGTWDAAALTLGPVPNDLSSPPALG